MHPVRLPQAPRHPAHAPKQHVPAVVHPPLAVGVEAAVGQTAQEVPRTQTHQPVVAVEGEGGSYRDAAPAQHRLRLCSSRGPRARQPPLRQQQGAAQPLQQAAVKRARALHAEGFSMAGRGCLALRPAGRCAARPPAGTSPCSSPCTASHLRCRLGCSACGKQAAPAASQAASRARAGGEQMPRSAAAAQGHPSLPPSRPAGAALVVPRLPAAAHEAHLPASAPAAFGPPACPRRLPRAACPRGATGSSRALPPASRSLAG